MNRLLAGSASVVVAILLGLVAWVTPSQAGTKKCSVPKGAVKYGPWTVQVRSFSRDASKLIKPPAGRVVMSAEVTVWSATAGNSPGRLLDIDLIPTNSRNYRGTIVAGEVEAMKDVKVNEQVSYTLVYPVETKDKDKKLLLELDDFSGAIAEEKLIPVC
jgi:hypothetical protein